MMRTCLVGRDKINWAIDKEFLLTKSLLDFVKFDNIIFSEIIHCVNWEYLLKIPKEFLYNKKIICHLTHDPEIAFKNPRFTQVSKIVSIWIVRSSKSKSEFEKLGLLAFYIPYTYSKDIFFPINEDLKEKYKYRFNIPNNKYLIGSFQRDSVGGNLNCPKQVKGPDVFLEICKFLHKEQKNIHIILAGPRRHWLINEIENESIPYTYVGKKVDTDDIYTNNLPQETVNILYNLIDLYIVSSRFEGGPQSIIEAAAVKCKIISTDVGHAKDILQNETIYYSVKDAIEIVKKDIDNSYLDQFIEKNYSKVTNYLPQNQKKDWIEVYNIINNLEKIKGKDLCDFQNLFALTSNFVKKRLMNKT